MNQKTIDKNLYKQMLIGGASMLSAHVDELNALNVFPVADGDTGANMLKTMEGGLSKLNDENILGIGELTKVFARGALLSARGNSGVILSQIFAGITEGLKDLEMATVADIAKAYQNGIKKSYSAVQNPTEGTILTVFRESTEYASKNINENSTIEDFFKLHIEEGQRSLKRTKELLPVLKEADVVDSGASGYLCIAVGMFNSLTGKTPSYEYRNSQQPAQEINIDLFTRDSVLEFGYCTEFLLRLTTNKVDPDSFKIETMLNMLKEMKGESVVAYKQGDIVKVHVHTFTPGLILAKAQQFGEFLTVKIENMSLGHSETPKKPKKNKPFSIVAVAQGEGIVALFKQMGVEQIIMGGQTANPSIEEFISAFKNCESDNILVFPNNKNILLAAKQAKELYKEGNIYIIETKNLMEGYSALSVITPGVTDLNTLQESAQRACDDVIDGEITRAVRDAEIDGLSIKKGDYIAISGGEIKAFADNPESAVIKMLEKTDTDLCEIITLFTGKNVTDENRVKLTEELKELYEDCEIVVYEGGQDVYDYYVAVE